MSYLNDLYRAFELRLAQNPPTGYTINDIVNVDRGTAKTLDTKHLVQRTQLGLRQFVGLGENRCVRQFFIHTIGVYVDNSKRLDRAGILTTASELQTLFEKVEFDQYKTQVAELDIFGKEPNTKFYRVDININGYYEESL